MLNKSKLLTLSLFVAFNCFASDDSGEGRPFSPDGRRPNCFTPISPALFAELSTASVSPLSRELDDNFNWADEVTARPDSERRILPNKFDIAVEVARIKAAMKK